MTAEELEKLKQEQRQAIKGGNIAEINRINKMLFEERERRQKAKEQARTHASQNKNLFVAVGWDY